MRPTNDYAQTKGYTAGESPAKLPAGGYVCRILSAREGAFPNGDPCLQIALEIAEGEYAGSIREQFERKKQFNDNAKWPAILMQGTTVKGTSDTNPYFKGLITAIQESNIGYTWNWDEKTLANKLLGVVFREEQFYNQQTGELQSTVRPFYGCSTAQIKMGVATPKPKPPRQQTPAQASMAAANALGMMAEVVDDDELPFE